MAKISINLPLLRKKTGNHQIQLEVNNLVDALEKCQQQLGIDMGNSCILLLNGQSLDAKDLPNVELKDGDTLNVFPIIAGG